MCLRRGKLNKAFRYFLPKIFWALFDDFPKLSASKSDDIGLIFFQYRLVCMQSNPRGCSADEKNIVHLLFCGTGHLKVIHGPYFKSKYIYSGSSNRANVYPKKISPNLKSHYLNLYHYIFKKSHYFKEIALIIV